MCFSMLFLDTACRMFVFLLVVHCVLSSGIIKETMNEWMDGWMDYNTLRRRFASAQCIDTHISAKAADIVNWCDETALCAECGVMP